MSTLVAPALDTITDPVVLYRRDQFMAVGLGDEISTLLAMRPHWEACVEDARRLKRMGATPAQILRIIW